MHARQLPSIQLPILLIVLFGGLGAIALLLLYRRNLQLRRAAEEQFRAFRERAVGLMDQIDALRARHKALPTTDPDFTVPMAGATRRLYDGVAADLDRLWERWLAAMELWGRAERTMRSESMFGAAASEEARAMIADERLEDLLRESERCKRELDRLNLAHEVATRSLRDARRESAALGLEVERGEAGPAGTTPRRIDRELDDAEASLTADPVGAGAAIERLRDEIAELRRPAAPRGPRAGLDPSAPTRTILDDLAVAASRLQEMASRIRVMDIVGLLLKGWVALWVLGLFLAILPALMPLILLVMAFVVFGSGVRAFRVMAAPWTWDRIGPREFGRRRGRRGREKPRAWW